MTFKKLGIGDWGLGIGPNPQSPLSSLIYPFSLYNHYLFLIYIIILL